MGVNDIPSTVPPSIEEDNQDTENRWALNENDVRAFLAQDTPSLQGLRQIFHRPLQQFAPLPVVDMMHRGTQMLCQEITAPMVTYPGNERDVHGITSLH